MKNSMVIDGAENCVYDIFTAPYDDFALIFSDLPTLRDEEASNPDGSALR